jgi:LPXTG-site transpeptidase (sortase) family protein
METQYFKSEIHRLLKLGPDLSKPYQPTEDSAPQAVNEIALGGAVPLNLPIASVPSFNPDAMLPNFNPTFGESVQMEIPTFTTAPAEIKAPRPNAAQPTQTKGVGSYLVYPLVFGVAFAFFYVILNFNALLLQVQGWFAKDEDEVILEEDLTAYNNWIGGYFFAVQDTEKLEPNNDIDFDGLSNLDEFGIKTNPTIADSDSDGVSDGIEVINGTNPWGLGQMTEKQKKLIKELDMIKINNRISFNAAAKNGPNLGEHSKNFDTTKPGRLSIPRLNLQVPLIWTEDPANFDTDLTRGVVHYPGTALPGELGTVYVSGHSSDYFWKDHPYKQVFARINALEAGDDIFVEVYGNDGKIYNYKYRVTTETIYSPDDQRQFIDNSAAKLNLSTCWPIGTQKDRYVVTAELENL